MMTKVTISIPDSVKNSMMQKIEQDGFGTVSEYIRELIRRDQRGGEERTGMSHAYGRRTGQLRAEHWNDTIGDLHEPFPRHRRYS